jgi:putative two-component system hydrogenase maturation factor HypX/HoxX
MNQRDRRIDWANDPTEQVLRKIRAADGFPGVADEQLGRRLFLYNASAAPTLRGTPGTIVATSGTSIGVATVDGGIWIGHLRDPNGEHPFKLPATRVIATAHPETRLQGEKPGDAAADVRFEARDGIGYLHFPFYNGAMGSEQCEMLRQAYRDALETGPRIIVLCGGPEFWSNGMDLNRIEAADSAAEESWQNINAIDDLAAEIINSTDHLTIAALRGNAGAGGVFLARAADQVWAHGGVILNPHYKDMGNLYGSEYWTYLLPRCCGEERARDIMEARLPIGVREARELGLVDRVLASNRRTFDKVLHDRVTAFAETSDLAAMIVEKKARRDADERERPLADYRRDELERMRLNFFGFDPSYHVARYNFVYKIAKSRTPLTIATHRRASARNRMRDVS